MVGRAEENNLDSLLVVDFIGSYFCRSRIKGLVVAVCPADFSASLAKPLSLVDRVGFLVSKK